MLVAILTVALLIGLAAGVVHERQRIARRERLYAAARAVALARTHHHRRRVH